MFYKFTKTVDEIMKELDFKQDELQDIKYMVITYHHVYLNYITSKIDDDFRQIVENNYYKEEQDIVESIYAKN